ncbi:MAG: endonuclease domain-containing protein [Solirubrobacterales bacterium]
MIEARGRAIHVSGDATNGTLDGVHRHRVSLVPEEITVHDGIPTTTVERTLLDLAPLTSTPRLRRMADQAQILGLLDLTALRSVVRRRAGHRGIRALREVLDDMGAPEVTRSELEDRFLAFCAERAIPAPTMNVAVELAGRHFVLDAVWGAAQVCVELDGWQSHGTRLSFESDRDRDRRLTAAGWRVVRITWRQLHSESDRVAADLRAVLRGRRGPDSAVIGQEIRYSLWSDW